MGAAAPSKSPAPQSTLESAPSTAPGYALLEAGGRSAPRTEFEPSDTRAIVRATSFLEESLDAALTSDELEEEPEPVGSGTWVGAVGAVAAVEYVAEPPNLGQVPLIGRPHSPPAEDYRLLRQRLRNSAPHARTLVLAAPREHGLSSEIAVNLALALGEDSSEPVLIVDANHVIPSIAALLGVTPPECFAIQMRSNLERRLDQKHWVATSIGFDHVHLLAIDPNTEPEKRRFDPPTFREALAALKRSPYSHVLVDLAPPLLSAGVNLAGEEADGVLLAALARTTRGSHLKQTAERLAPLPVLGTVLFRP